LRRDWELPELLESLSRRSPTTSKAATEGTVLPALSCHRESDAAVVTYESGRDTPILRPCPGILEGIVAAFDVDATVAETACAGDGADACQFRVDLEA